MTQSAPGEALHPPAPSGTMPGRGPDSPAPDAPAASAEQIGGTRAAVAGVFEELSGALRSGRAAFSAYLELVTLEARRAGIALIWMIAGAVVGAICVVTAWIGLMAAFALGAVSLGFHPITAAIAVSLLNVAAGAGLIYGCIGMTKDLLFSATRRQISGRQLSADSPSVPQAKP